MPPGDGYLVLGFCLTSFSSSSVASCSSRSTCVTKKSPVTNAFSPDRFKLKSKSTNDLPNGSDGSIDYKITCKFCAEKFR